MARRKKTNLEKAQTAINDSVKKLSEDETMKFWEWLKEIFGALFDKKTDDKKPPVEDPPIHPDSPPTPIDPPKPPEYEREISHTLAGDPDLFAGGQNAFGIVSDKNGVTADPVDSGSGWRLFSLVSSENARVVIPEVQKASYKPETALISAIDPKKDVTVVLKVTNQFHGIIITYTSKIKPIDPPIDPPKPVPVSSGRLRVNKFNPRRLVDTDGNPVHLIGIQDCFGTHGDSPDFRFALEEKATVDTDTFLRTWREVGKNILFRYSVNNCNFPLNSETNLRRADGFINKLYELGFYIQFVFFMNTVDMSESGFAFVEQMIARYGDKVDIWEVCNESTSSDADQKRMLDFIKSKSGKLVTTSFRYSYPVDYQNIEGSAIASPHLYSYGVGKSAGTEVKEIADRFRQSGVPTQIGEFGYAATNYPEGADDTNRVNQYVALFNEICGLVYWNQTFTKDYSAPNSVANIYLGAKTRSSLKVFADYVERVPADAFISSIQANLGSVKAYALSSSEKFFAYLHASDGESIAEWSAERSGIEIQINLPRSGVGKWIDTKTGNVVGSARTVKGVQNLPVPSFSIDIALEVQFEKETPIEINPPKVRDTKDFPAATASESIKKAFDSLENGFGEVWSTQDGILNTNHVISDKQKLVLKKGMLQLQTAHLLRSPAFLIDDGAKLYGEDAVMIENDAADGWEVGKGSPYCFVMAKKSNDQEPDNGGVPFTLVTKDYEIAGLKLRGIKSNRHDGGTNSAIYMGNSHNAVVKDIESDGVSAYTLSIGGFARKGHQPNGVRVENFYIKNNFSQNFGIIYGSNLAFKNITMVDPGKPPYKITDIRVTAAGSIQVETDEDCHTVDGSGVDIYGVEGMTSINGGTFRVKKINRRTYELGNVINGSGVDIPGTKPKANGKWIVGTGSLLGGNPTFAGADFETNVGGVIPEAQWEIVERVRFTNKDKTLVIPTNDNEYLNASYEFQKAFLAEIKESEMAERFINVTMDDCLFDFQNQNSQSGSAIAFQPTAWDVVNYGCAFRNIKILGDKKGKTTIGSQMTGFSRDVTFENFEVSDCSAGVVFAGEGIKANNIKTIDCGRGGNAAIEIYNCIDSKFSNIRMETGGRGNPVIFEGKGNSDNKFSEIYSDGVKIR